MNWLLLNSGKGDPAWNMALDEALLEAMPRLQTPVLRFYGWSVPAASFGYFQHHTDVERATLLRPLVRRPTGGGLVPHDADWTYSAVFPARHEWHSLKAEESYRRIHEWIQAAFARMAIETELAPGRKILTAGAEFGSVPPSQCFVGHEKSDLLWHGRKIAGAAQRRNRLGLLIQGSVQPPPGSPPRTAWQEAMAAVARDQFGATWIGFQPDPDLTREAARLEAEKYSRPAYNRRR